MCCLPAEPGCAKEACPLSCVEPWHARSADPERSAQPAEATALVRGLAGVGPEEGDLDAGVSSVLDFLAQALADRLAVCRVVRTAVGDGTGDTDSSVSC